jgi:hypothetical protein
MRLSRSSNTEALTASQGKRNLSVSATNASAEATPNVMEIAMLSALQRLNYNLENPKPSAAVLDYNRFDEDYSTFKQTIEDSNV